MVLVKHFHGLRARPDTNLGEIIIGVVDDDTLGVYFGMSSDSRQNSYTYNFNNGRVSSIDNFQVGGDPLDGWNFMFRLTWLVKNTTVPNSMLDLCSTAFLTISLKYMF